VSAATGMWSASTAFTVVTDALERSGQRGTGSGRQRMYECPAHEDRTPSLSVTDGESRVLVYCHARCDTGDVVAAIGLATRDLFHEPGQRWTPWREKCACQPVASYPYVDETGRLLFEVVRGEHKEFSQRRPDPSSRSGWRWSLGDVRRVLYRLPRILAAPPSACVLVVEGERDVHALEAAGEVATCNPGGAGKWRPEYAQVLAGRDVLVVADRDDPGRDGRRAGADHAWGVLESIRPVARFAWIVQSVVGKDAADHLAAGLRVTDLVWWSL
jgi:hypothetical protein